MGRPLTSNRRTDTTTEIWIKTVGSDVIETCGTAGTGRTDQAYWISRKKNVMMLGIVRNITTKKWE
ncbi:hypothetical protein PMAYCL1PPCAC_10592, partial [Pristionchus mayeri]